MPPKRSERIRIRLLPAVLAALVAVPASAIYRPASELPEAAPGFKRIVICLDGTWNNPYKLKERYDEREDRKKEVMKPTNVLKTCRAVLPVTADGVRQISYYDIGVGGLNKHPGPANRLLKTADSVLGGAWGAGFETRVEDAYRFIAHNYEPGDRVYVFGFSRGAAAARALTRFIAWMGGVPVKGDVYYASLYFRSYLTDEGRRQGPGAVGKNIELHPVEVEFLGVWDTVLALGSRLRARNEKKAFHVGESPAGVVKNARQALAIDERRFDFLPEIWTSALAGQSLEQRWFAGVHSNIGGGYVDDGLANLALAWMLSEAHRAGLELDWGFLFSYRPFAFDALYDSRKLMYKAKEALTFRRGRGVRKLAPASGLAVDVAAAGLSLDCSVLHRLAAKPGEHEYLPDAYGPGTRALVAYQASCEVAQLPGAVEGGCLPVSRSVSFKKSEPPSVKVCTPAEGTETE